MFLGGRGCRRCTVVDEPPAILLAEGTDDELPATGKDINGKVALGLVLAAIGSALTLPLRRQNR